MKKRVVYVLALLSGLVLAATAAACGKNAASDEVVLSGFDVPAEAVVAVGSEYTIPVPLVTDGDGNVYEVSYTVTRGGQTVTAAGGLFVADTVGDYTVTYTVDDGSGPETRSTLIYARYRAAVTADRSELYVGETVTAGALGIRVYTGESESAAGLTLTLTAADGSVVTGAVPSAGTYELKVTMRDDTYFAESTFVMQAVDPVTVTIDTTDICVIVGESVDLAALSPTVYDRLADSAETGYSFAYASDTAEISGSLFTATDAGGQTVTVTATGAEGTVIADVTIPTRATAAQTNALYTELLAAADKTTDEFYAQGARLQRYYDSLPEAERADVDATGEEISYLAGGVVYGGDKLVYFDSPFGQKQILRMADGYQTTADGEYMFDYHNYAFVTGDNYITGESGVLKLMRPNSMYAVHIYFDGSKIPGDFDDYGTLGFKLRHNGSTTNGKIICVLYSGETMVKRTVDIAADREILFTFNL